ncbi:MAG TPA: DNA-processing protein DprA [Ilumatobacter sp.]
MSAGALAALAGLGAMGPQRLRLLLAHHDPDDALHRLAGRAPLHHMFVAATPPALMARLRRQAAGSSPEGALAACERCGVLVVGRGDPRYPGALVVDPEPPEVIFVRGTLDALRGRRVGVVGTRHATAAGLATARELGAALAGAGVAVVSGLARGIDAAAHRGVRSAGGSGRAVAVVGSGPDVVYPAANAELWEWVASDGLLISEFPPGTSPEAWRFPQRNRILAALCEVLVVVESRERGGSLITARAAAERSVEVMAVPGSPRNPAAAGTNRLLVDGAAPVTSADDVLLMLGLDHRRQGDSPFDPRPAPDPLQAMVLASCIERPCTLDMLVSDTGAPLAAVALAAARLERDGRLLEAGGWFESAGSRLAAR